MAFFKISNVRIAGFSACVPKTIEDNLDYSLFQGDEAEKFVQSTGVRFRRRANEQTTTSDLCYHAAERLVADLNWAKSEIDALIFVSQTPDFITPATACILQERLGLSTTCYAMDISSGCSGWVYGLSTLAALMQTGGIRKALLLVGDTTLRTCSATDKSTWPLFGDAGAVTALEFSEKASPLCFQMGTDGSGMEAIIIPDGGLRHPFNEQSLKMEQFEEGIERNRLQTVLNGMDVFSFGINIVPQSIKQLTDHFGIEISAIDLLVFHQANLFMLEKIRKKVGIPSEKVPYSLHHFGNTSSATIPLTFVVACTDQLKSPQRIIASGFGVGLSWASVYIETESVVCSELVEI